MGFYNVEWLKLSKSQMLIGQNSIFHHFEQTIHAIGILIDFTNFFSYLQYFSNRPAPTPGPNLPMPNSLANKDSGLSDFEIVPGSKRKLREGIEGSGLAKKLVF